MTEFDGFDNLCVLLCTWQMNSVTAPPERAVLIGGSAPKGKVPWGNECPGTKIEIKLKCRYFTICSSEQIKSKVKSKCSSVQNSNASKFARKSNDQCSDDQCSDDQCSNDSSVLMIMYEGLIRFIYYLCLLVVSLFLCPFFVASPYFAKFVPCHNRPLVETSARYCRA